MADNKTEKSSYSGFERFLFFLTPILFTAVMLGMLLLLFNPEWRNKALEAGNKVPVLKAVLPDPSSPQGAPGTSDEEITASNAKQKVDELKALLAEREASLKEATRMTEQQQKEIADLKARLEQLNKDNQERTVSDEEYAARIRSLSDVYGRMTPAKAAPILESMTLDETALILGAMGDTERGRILEKMTPRTAADVSIRLKDSVTAENRQIAALQARVKELENRTGSGTSTLDTAELKQTFSSMAPDKAASLLLEMNASNQAKVLLILGAMDDSARSQVLAAMSDEDSKKTASIVSRLMPANP